MTKVVFAITLSFGLLVGLLFGNQSPAFAQSSPLLLQPAFVARPDAIPEIPEIKSHLLGANATGLRQPLDGMDISNSEFDEMTWEYSGGPFR